MPTSREFDLANVVCEFAYDYESTTPEVPNRANRCTDEQLRRLVKAYMGYDDDTDSKEVDSLMERIIMNRPIPHLFWGYWCLIEVAQKWEHQSGNYDFIRSAYWRFVQFLELSGN